MDIKATFISAPPEYFVNRANPPPRLQLSKLAELIESGALGTDVSVCCRLFPSSHEPTAIEYTIKAERVPLEFSFTPHLDK